MLKEEDPELIEILTTLNYFIVDKVIQKRQLPDKRYYIGSGKLDEIKTLLTSIDVDRIVVDGVLTPMQHHNLEHELQKDVRDRVWLVLEIFEKNAISYEAKLQVDLARMQYMGPFIREWIHKAKAGEHPGFMGGGEYGLDDYYLFIKRKKRQIIQQLKQKEVQKIKEKLILKERGWLIAGLAGYTNAGKSTLHRALCKSSVDVSPFIFTTLQPKSSSIKVWNAKIVIEDTIGFIEGLPNDVIEGFRTTLNCLKASDIILFVIDGSDPPEEIKRKVTVSFDIFKSNEISHICPILNKADLLNEKMIKDANKIVKDIVGKEPIPVSALKNQNLNEIIRFILQNTPRIRHSSMVVSNNIEPQMLDSLLKNIVYYELTPENNLFKIEYYCREELAFKIEKVISTIGL